MSTLKEAAHAIDMYQNGVLHPVEAFFMLMNTDIDIAFKFKQQENITQEMLNQYNEMQKTTGVIIDAYRNQ